MRGDPIPGPPTGGERQLQADAINRGSSAAALAPSPALPMNRLIQASPTPVSGGNMLAPSSAPAVPPQQPLPPGPPLPPPAAVPQFPPHPADDMPRMARAVAIANVPLEVLQQAGGAQEHAIHAIGTLLRKPGAITQADLNGAIAAATGSGKVSKAETITFSKALPPTSNQATLRAALETQMERSIKTLVVIAGEAQRRGIDLTGRGNAGGN